MIPRRISLKGFLCYREAQVIDFDGADLWVLSGRNGSGKSAVFDAMTFALFGTHRGGLKLASRLINSGSPGFEVIFDFDLGGDRYRIKRNFRQATNSGERLIYRNEAGAGEEVHWRPVTETQSKAGFERWIQDHLGLNHETFTSSVLLEQGQAEKLLGSDHRQRYNVLAGIEDLARYERLGMAADARKVAAKARAGAYRDRLATLPAIDDDAVAEAGRLAAEAEATREAAAAEWTRLAEIRQHACIWADLNGRRVQPRREADEAKALLADAEEIQSDWSRFRALDEVLPALKEASHRRTRLGDSEEVVRRRDAEGRGLARALDLTEALAGDMEAHRAEIAEEIGRDEARRLEVVKRLGDLSVPLDRALRARDHRKVADQFEVALAADPHDHDAEVRRLEDDLRRRSDWRAVLSTLDGYARDRDGLASAGEQARAARTALGRAEAEVAGLSAACEALNARIALAREAAGTAHDRATDAKAVLKRADGSLKDFLDLDGAAACDRCGQTLTPSHFGVESTRLRKEQAEARQQAEEALRQEEIARSSCQAAENAARDAGLRLQDARSTANTYRHRLDQAERDASRHGESCSRAYRGLPEPFRNLVAAAPPTDWVATTFPAAADLDDARRLVDEIETVAARRDEACRRRDERQALLVRRDEARRAAAGLGFDEAAEAALAAEHAALAAERSALDRCLESHGHVLELAEETLDHLAERCRGFRGRLAAIDRALSAGRACVDGLRAEVGRSLAAAPEAWRDAIAGAATAEIDGWEAEHQTLLALRIEERAEGLPRAQFQLHSARTVLDALDRQIGAIPEEARRAPEQIAPAVAAAKQRLDAAEAAWRDAAGLRGQLGRDLESRRSLEADALGAEREQAISETLAQLLGWQGLQRHRLREAELSILNCTNRFLRVISGGDLELVLAEGGDTQRALNLEAKVRTHGETRVVGTPFLSGSQKFRVAVSLALGIGQHARGAGRPIESVIIDEGFGCLDRQGRQEMIAQLGDLQGVLARIILVSHQEEIADAFPDGYRFEVIDGATVAEPFHR